MDQSRHLGLYSIPYYMRVTLIGAGGIGALAAVTLTKMGINFLNIWDGDKVDPINLATQLHRVSDVGKSKVDAVAGVAHMFSDEARVTPFNTPVHELSEFGNSEIVISAVDSITARQAIWQAVIRNNPPWYLDTRMSAEVFQMHVINMESHSARNAYDNMIRNLQESDVPDVVCTEKATFFCAAMASGHIGAAVKRIVTGDDKSYQVVHYIATNTLYELGLA